MKYKGGPARLSPGACGYGPGASGENRIVPTDESAGRPGAVRHVPRRFRLIFPAIVSKLTIVIII